MFANTPKPPYYAVIFTSTLAENTKGYEQTADQILQLAQKQPGFLGFESARDKIGISVSYWQTLEDIKQWKAQSEHQVAQQKGKRIWYQDYHIRICKVEADYTKQG